MIRKISYIIGVYFITTMGLQAQMQTAHWYFGNYAGLDFTSGSPVVVTDGQIKTEEGCTSISDEYGNLLFYTDGRRIYDSTHNTMQNGTGLRGDLSSTTSAIVLPVPDNCNLYYVFTIDVQDGRISFNLRPRRGLEYNIVDMSLNGGLGAVVEKNIELPINGQQQGSEKLAAISNADKTGYWVVTFFEGNFYAFSVTDNGIDHNPVVSSTSAVQPVEPGYYEHSNWDWDIGYLKGSPDGAKLAMGMEGGPMFDRFLTLYDFDNATGIVSNEVVLHEPNSNSEINYSFYGIEFSVDSKVLYTSCNIGNPIISAHSYYSYEIWQYNLEASSIPDSKYVIESGKWGALQRGLDDKIYNVSLYSKSLYMGIIENPEVVYNPVTGEAPIYNSQGIYMGETMYWGLPTFLNHYFRISITINGLANTGSYPACEVLDFDFCSQGGHIQSIHWDFGDGTTSTEMYPSHGYNTSGLHTVILTLMVDGEEYVRTIDFEVVGPDAEDGVLEACNTGGNHTFDLSSALPQINPANENYTITFHTTGHNARNDSNSLPNAYTTDTDTTLFVRVEDTDGCYIIKELSLLFIGNLNIQTDTSLLVCPEISIELIVSTSSENTVNWYTSATGTTPFFTGSSYQTPALTQNTSYWVEAVSPGGECTSERLEIKITLITDERPYFDLQQVYCINALTKSLPTTSNNGIHGSWSPSIVDTSVSGTQTYIFTSEPGDCTSSFQLELIVQVMEMSIVEFNDITECFYFINTPQPLPTVSDNGIMGTWYPSVIDTNASGTRTYTFIPNADQCADPFSIDIEAIGYPKFFTPNNDGYHDSWNIWSLQNQPESKITIYDRYGKLLTVIKPQGTGWNGTYNGKQLPSTDYWFVVTYRDCEGLQREFKAHFALKR